MNKRKDVGISLPTSFLYSRPVESLNLKLIFKCYNVESFFTKLQTLQVFHNQFYYTLSLIKFLHFHI